MVSDLRWDPSGEVRSSQASGFSRGLARSIWIVGAVLLVTAGGVGYVMFSGSSGDSSDSIAAGAPPGTAAGATPELAARYRAIADDANTRSAPINAELDRLLAQGGLTTTNAAQTQDALRRLTAITRDFDTKLTQIPFPPTIAADAQAIIAADAQINANADMISAGNCATACTAWADSAPYFDLRTKAIQKLRADLGLPPTT